jgi:hypothetical protein
MMLEYLSYCQQEVFEKTATLNFQSESGFYWLGFSKFELQLYSIRPIQQHGGELMERLGERAGEIGWGSSY